jgi:hypothetical protein
MTARRRLENRRPAETFELEVAGLRYTCTVGRFSDGTVGEVFLQNHKPASHTCTVGRFSDGTVGEVFLQNHKPASQSDCNARDAAVAASLALQFGCPLEVLRHALLRDSQGRPSTPLGAAVDAIAERGQP